MARITILERMTLAAEAGAPCPPLPDLDVDSMGSVATLRALTAAGAQWLADNVPVETWQMFGGAVCLEPACLPAIVKGARADGLTVEGAQ
jgi:hypothetical protein